jgi:hypothetical protein
LKAYTSEEVVYVTSTKWDISVLKARDASCRAAVPQIARVGIVSRKTDVDFKLILVNDSKYEYNGIQRTKYENVAP